MCGFAAWYDKSGNLRNRRELIDNMSATLSMRGPDEKGDYTTDNLSLIHRRLSVVDIETGHQPMTYENERGKFIIVYNGELYNTDEIRCELIKHGMSFFGHCDTEVVLKAYATWGERCLSKFNGIFAFCVWSEYDNSLFFARDRIGVKPLYYAQYNGGIVSASRIRTILESKAVDPIITENSLNEIFMLGPARSIGNGIYKDVKELPPAHYMVYKDDKVYIEPYWKLEAKEHTENLDQTIEHTLFLVKDSIERQLVSDVPLATFLSGGLDSSIISKVAADYYKEKGRGQLNTYSVDYTDNEKYFEESIFQPNSDKAYIEMMQEFINSKHHSIILNNKDLAESLVDSTYARDIPGMADVDSSLYLFCKEVKKDFTVALSGECADEIFGGYPWYHNRDILFDSSFPWSRSTVLRNSILRDGLLKNGDEYVQNAYNETVKSTSTLPHESSLEKRMKEMFVLNMNWFMQTLLVRKDTMSMENSLEVRVPFCDYRIVEYAYNMPWSMKALDGREKGILRKAVENILPHDVVWRKKSPYPKTHNPIYFNIVCEQVREILSEKGNPLCDMLNRDKLLWLMENPSAIPIPWYGQLMQTPQIMAYIIQIDTFFKDNNVIIQL